MAFILLFVLRLFVNNFDGFSPSVQCARTVSSALWSTVYKRKLHPHADITLWELCSIRPRNLQVISVKNASVYSLLLSQVYVSAVHHC